MITLGRGSKTNNRCCKGELDPSPAHHRVHISIDFQFCQIF